MSRTAADLMDEGLHLVHRARYWRGLQERRGYGRKTAENFEQQLAGLLAYMSLRMRADVERYEQTGFMPASTVKGAP